MKKVIVSLFFACIATSLFSAQALEDQNTAACLGELFAADKEIGAERRMKKGAVGSLAAVALYGATKTSAVQELFPELFPRSGMSSLIGYTLAGLVVSGSAWVGLDYLRSLQYTASAQKDMHRAAHELAKLKTILEELKSSQLEAEDKRKELETKVKEAHANSVAARESMEATESGVTELIKQMKGDLGNAVHIKEVVALKNRVSEMEELLQEVSLKQLRYATEGEPQIDKLARKAAELAQAARRFERTEDQSANTQFVEKIKAENKKKRPWWKIG
jgi:hypothetical protein